MPLQGESPYLRAPMGGYKHNFLSKIFGSGPYRGPIKIRYFSQVVLIVAELIAPNFLILFLTFLLFSQNFRNIFPIPYIKGTVDRKTRADLSKQQLK